MEAATFEYNRRFRRRLVVSCGVFICFLVLVLYSHESHEAVNSDLVGYVSEDSASINREKKLLKELYCRDFRLDLYISEHSDCKSQGLERLSRAFQIENCHAATRSLDNAEQVEEKFHKLADNNAFVFFRGAAALFDFDMMCADKHFRRKVTGMPRVISNGDCHPENFGVLVQANEKLVWGVNDFDQSFNTPFAWDIKRGATGFYLSCHVLGYNQKVCSRIASSFVTSYLEIVMQPGCSFANDERFIEGSSMTKKFKVISDLFEKARRKESKEKTIKWLEEKMNVDLVQMKFVKSENIIPLDEALIPEFQESVDAYLYHGVSGLAKFANDGFYKVLAVAKKLGSGTGSIGLERYYILINGRYEDYGNIILEMKEETNSVLESFFHYKYTASQEGKRATDNEHSAWPYANLFYGWTTYRNNSYIVREKSKHHVSAKIEKYNEEEFVQYAEASGKATGYYHIRARCNNHQCSLQNRSAVDLEICHQIQHYLKAYKGNFHKMIMHFAAAETKRQVEAWNLLKNVVTEAKKRDQSVLKILSYPMH